MEKIRSIDTGLFQSKTIQCYFRADGKLGCLKKGLERICEYAVHAVEDGFKVLILQDRAIDSNHAPIPSLLSTSAIHHHLIRKGMRGQVGIIVEAGDVWEVHHFACLVGFGATAIKSDRKPTFQLSVSGDKYDVGFPENRGGSVSRAAA